uniref:NF-kappa-B essential modulator NEMO CC2-LZ domain-containing protein n=1 Tax=Terrapene triunguis TaxID=2587831 RepID=A0A674IAF3_9SAUR
PVDSGTPPGREAQAESTGEHQPSTYCSEDTTVSRSKYIDFSYLLEVNKQWDQQFRSMKQHYEIKLAEVKAKLSASQRSISELEKERHRHQQECEAALARDGPLQEKEKEILNKALNELKEENKLLKEQKASVTKKREYYECEISRLNKV